MRNIRIFLLCIFFSCVCSVSAQDELGCLTLGEWSRIDSTEGRIEREFKSGFLNCPENPDQEIGNFIADKIFRGMLYELINDINLWKAPKHFGMQKYKLDDLDHRAYFDTYFDTPDFLNFSYKTLYRIRQRFESLEAWKSYLAFGIPHPYRIELMSKYTPKADCNSGLIEALEFREELSGINRLPNDPGKTMAYLISAASVGQLGIFYNDTCYIPQESPQVPAKALLQFYQDSLDLSDVSLCYQPELFITTERWRQHFIVDYPGDDNGKEAFIITLDLANVYDAEIMLDCLYLENQFIPNPVGSFLELEIEFDRSLSEEVLSDSVRKDIETDQKTLINQLKGKLASEGYILYSKTESKYRQAVKKSRTTRQQMAIWTFDSLSYISHDTELLPKHHILKSEPSVRLSDADIAYMGTEGISYLDIEMQQHVAGRAIGWDDVATKKKGDGELFIKFNTLDWYDLRIGFNYTGSRLETFTIFYLNDLGYRQTIASHIPLTPSNNWNRLELDLTNFNELENRSEVVLRFDHFEKGDGNGRLFFDNIEISGIYKDRIFDPISKFLPNMESEKESNLPVDFHLMQNYPNPFNNETKIKFSVNKQVHLTLSVFNTNGQLIKVLKDEDVLKGEYTTVWDGKDSQGNLVSTGVYFCQLKSKNLMQNRKIILLK